MNEIDPDTKEGELAPSFLLHLLYGTPAYSLCGIRHDISFLSPISKTQVYMH